VGRRDTDKLGAAYQPLPGHLIADRVVIENRLAAKGEVKYWQTFGRQLRRPDGGERESTPRTRFQDHPL